MLMSFGRRRPSLFTVDGQLVKRKHVGMICDAEGIVRSHARAYGDIPGCIGASPSTEINMHPWHVNHDDTKFYSRH